MIEDFLKFIPETLNDESGAVFYAGRTAFGASSRLYILGLNPGSDPKVMRDNTVKSHTLEVLGQADNWSAYQDERWNEHDAGTWGMQPRVLHLLRQLKLQPHNVPASNLVFKRTRTESGLKSDFSSLAKDCWPFHEQVIARLEVKVVLCFGQRVGDWVRHKVGADTLVETLVETNNRQWSTRGFENCRGKGVKVVVAPHPSRANWANPNSDPSPLVRGMLDRK
jgi:Uracil DNA glycosylase superfamily